MKCKLDNYEKKLIDEKTNNANDPAFQKGVITSMVELWEDAVSANLTLVNELLKGDFTRRLADWVERSFIYQNFYAFLDQRLVAGDKIFDRKTISHLVVPLLLQELEGPVKWSVLSVGFLQRLRIGKRKSWQNYHRVSSGRVKYLSEAINETKDVLPKKSPLYEVVDGLEPPDHDVRSNLVRRAIAHSDFTVQETNADVIVVIHDPVGDLELPFNEMMKAFHVTLDLTGLLALSHYIGIRCINRLRS